MNQDTGRMLEQSSKSKYEFKLRNLLINSLSLTGTDIQVLLRKFWCSYCNQSLWATDCLKTLQRVLGLSPNALLSALNWMGTQTTIKMYYMSPSMNCTKTQYQKPNTKPFNFTLRLWKQTSTPGICSWYSKLFPLLPRLLHSNLCLLHKLWLAGNGGCSCHPQTGLLQNPASAQSRNLIKEQCLSPV